MNSYFKTTHDNPCSHNTPKVFVVFRTPKPQMVQKKQKKKKNILQPNQTNKCSISNSSLEQSDLHEMQKFYILNL